MTVSETIHVHHESPVGRLTLVGRTHGDEHRLMGLYFDDQKHPPDRDRLGRQVPDGLSRVREQLDQYFAGQRCEFEVPVHLNGTEFQRRVWDRLRTIPYGQTRSYGDIAAHVGGPKTTRAVGVANGRNPIAIIVPCHRVVGTDGNLVGYAGGLERKRWLLDHESGTARLFGD